MTKTYRYVVWAHRDAQSIFGAAANPVIRNGEFLYFDDKKGAQVECDRLNARSNPYIHYLVKRAATRSLGETPAKLMSGQQKGPAASWALGGSPV